MRNLIDWNSVKGQREAGTAAVALFFRVQPGEEKWVSGLKPLVRFVPQS